MERIKQITSHLEPSPRAKLLQRQEDDIVLCSAVRTPLTRARKGGLANTSTDVLLSAVLKEVVNKVSLDPKLVEDIIVGNVLSPAGGAGIARMAAFAAGFPATTSVAATNRQCSSGLHALAIVASFIQSGVIDIGIGCGVESMTLYHFNRHQMRIGTDGLNDLSKSETLSIPDAADCLIPMGFTSENVASDYGITREEQDVFALHSMQKAAKAQETGFFDSEIIPVHLPDNKIVDTDDGIRPETSLEALSKIRPAFKTDGSTTGGNASQVTDGAAAVLMTRRSKAKELGLPILGKYCSFVTAGVPPRVMGIGPAYAIPKLFTKTRITKEDVDFFEINEAFASQAIYCIETLGLPKEKVNPVGGAIALGHPLGATGARQVVTALNYASRMNKPQLFVTSMCMGSGMGAAALFVSEA